MKETKSSNKENLDFKYNLKTYWSFLKKYKLLLFGVLLSALLIEASSTADKYLFKIAIDNGGAYLSNEVTRSDFASLLITLAIVFASLIVFRSIMKGIHLQGINVLDARLILDLKKRFFNHIIHLSHNFHTTHKTGSLISRLLRGGSAMERMTDVFVLNAAPLVFQLFFVSLFIIYFSWITSIIVIATAIAFISYSFVMQQVQRKANAEFLKTEDIEKANVADIFTNIDSVKYFGKEKVVKGKFASLAENTKKALIRYWNYYIWMDSGQTLIIGIGTFFILYVPFVQFLNKQITLGDLVFVYTIYGNLLGPMYNFIHGMRNFYKSIIDFNDLFQYGKFENEIKDAPNAQPLRISSGKVEFDNVSFSYNKRKVISNLSLSIKPGEKVALVGHSGCGKTTLVKLLYRFYDVNSGKIKIDGEDIQSFQQESLRSELSIVPQEAILFDDTIHNNILFSNPSATRKEVMQAMKFAQLDGFVSGLPNRENTIVGERGVKLSGGEKQRVSIARAILANRKILVLDEATSALDSQTESEIQKDLWRLMEGRTSIIIAHRLSTIMRADRIVVMEKGKIVQIGTHLDLIKKDGPYRHLWNLQKGGYLKE